MNCHSKETSHLSVQRTLNEISVLSDIFIVGYLPLVVARELSGGRCESGEVDGDAMNAGAGDREGEQSEGGARGGEERAEAEDWISAGLIDSEIAFAGPGRVGGGHRAGTGCEGGLEERGATKG
jgi:hypothetical protein